MLLRTCALIALIAFVQIARAQDEVEEVKPEVKQEDEEVHHDDKLDSRGGGGYHHGSRNGNRHGFGGDGGRGNDRGDSRGGSRGSGGSLDRNIEGAAVRIRNIGVTNKNIPGTVRVLPTTRTQSRRQRVLHSRKNEYFQQNSKSIVVQNNVVKKTKVHVNTDVTVHVPETVKTFVKKHHTKFIVNTQPIQTLVNIERKQDIYKPQVKNIVIYKNSQSIQRNRLNTITRRKQAFERLKTIWEPTHNEGTRVIGNPLSSGTNNLLSNLNNGLSESSQVGNSFGFGGSDKYFNREHSRRGGAYGLHNRAGEAVQEEEEVVTAEMKE